MVFWAYYATHSDAVWEFKSVAPGKHGHSFEWTILIKISLSSIFIISCDTMHVDVDLM